MNYRDLTTEEIKILERNGCFADDWTQVRVKDGFYPENIQHVHFSGTNLLGVCKKRVVIEKGVERISGLYNSFIRDCTAGDDVYISDVRTLSGYHIENDVVIHNVGSLVVTGETSFGNGTLISVLNEAGGRELMIYDKLSAQEAYMMVTSRDDSAFITELQRLIEKYTDNRKSATGTIGTGSKIRHCQTIRNVWIDAAAQITGVRLLEEGTVASKAGDPSIVGENVIAQHFIIQSGSVVDGGALLTHTFIGQGVRIGKQFSAENSAFFANSEGFHSEAVSVFGGPYTVTHHKSTLLIATMCSFYNAGSGTNQSNHMYKLGPVHQGILDRGAKTGSFSYLLWPSRVGPFSVVIGKHYVNFDASEFPFSYINEEDGKTVLIPAMNLFTVGVRRDSEKWPARDRRKSPEKYDTIHFDLFNPYIIGRILRALAVMQELREKSSKDQEYVSYKGFHIKRLMLKTCAKYYEMALKIYLGSELMKRISRIQNPSTFEDIKKSLHADMTLYGDEWIDMAGMLLPKFMYNGLIDSVKTGAPGTVDQLKRAISGIDKKYHDANWAFCMSLIERSIKSNIQTITKEQLVRFITGWKETAVKLNNMIMKDAEKEFAPSAQIGFGINGNEEVRQNEFRAIRGTFESNTFVISLKRESESIHTRADEVLKLLTDIAQEN
jgi:hypothetical protein